MGASDQVGSFGVSGQQLATLAARVKSDPAAITSIANTWSNAADNCQQQTTAVQAAVQAVSGDWSGSAQKAFASLMGQFDSTSGQVQSSLRSASASLTAAAKTLGSLQSNVEEICETLVDEVAQLQATENKLEGLDAKIEALASQAHGAAKKELEAAEADLQTVIGDLNKALAVVQNDLGFSGLPLPSGPGANPPSGTAGPPISVPAGVNGNSDVSLAGQASPAGGSGPVGAGASGDGPAPTAGPVSSGSGFENELTVAKYLVAHGYSKAAAAGIASCIDGESSGNPEAVGDGGFGLIGWTPQTPGEYANLQPTGNASADLSRQMAAILTYNNSNGNVAALNSISDPVQAADYYSQNFERPLVTDSDVRPGVATAIFQALGG
jgi:WXG100 family type VII secretion target